MLIPIVYLCGAREVMEEDLDPYDLIQDHWNPVEPAGLSDVAIETIANALVAAEEPLIITGYSGRNHACPPALVKLTETVKGLRVLDTGGSDMCFPADQPAWLGLRYGNDDSIRTADVILVIDCDVPWINTQCHPKKGARIFHIDVDPLKQQMPVFYLAAIARYRADSYTAITQLQKHLESNTYTEKLQSARFQKRWSALQEAHQARLTHIQSIAKPKEDNTFGTGYLCHQLRKYVPNDTIFTIEAVTNTAFVADNIQATLPGSWINCGGGGLGWSGGGTLGVKLATEFENGAGKGKFVCCIVGDGTFLFSVPGSVYWISQRYNIPVLTIVLNNNGWNAPRKSLLLVHPDGLGSKVSNEEINISFAPVPDYAGIAKAAAGGKLFAEKVGDATKLDDVLKRAVESVMSGTTAVVDAVVVSGC